jgi:tetratricopeptide (TPR) repeat protein
MEVIAEIEGKLEQDMYSAWFKGYIYMSRKDWQSALDAFDYVERLLNAQTFSGKEAYAECYYAKALCFLRLGNVVAAREKLEWVKARKHELRKTEIISDIRRNLSVLEDEIENKEKAV